jgi:uncharacterized caspase-like protein
MNMLREKRVALVIGNSAYANASLLKNPANDARDIAAALDRLGFSGIGINSSTDLTVTNTPLAPFFDLTYERLRRALAAFARATEETDLAILYYAGHGIEVGGRNYLIPIDARLEHVKDVGWETAALDDLMIGIEEGDGLRLIILDACRDNPFRSRMISTRSLSRGLASIEPPGNDILVAYSSEHGRLALDGTSNNSPYATALLAYLERPGLEVGELFREVRDHVKEITKSRQKPHTYGQLGRRKYYLVTPARQSFPPTDDESAQQPSTITISKIVGDGAQKDEPANELEGEASREPTAKVGDLDATVQLPNVSQSPNGQSGQPRDRTPSTATSIERKLPSPGLASGKAFLAAVSGLFIIGIVMFVVYANFPSKPPPIPPSQEMRVPEAPIPVPTSSPEQTPQASGLPSTSDQPASQAPASASTSSLRTSTLDLIGTWCRRGEKKSALQPKMLYSGLDGVVAENFYPSAYMKVDRVDDRITMADPRDSRVDAIYHLENGGSVLRMQGLADDGKAVVYHMAPCP